MKKLMTILFLTFFSTLLLSCDEDDQCVTSTWYEDLDGDGLGNAEESVEACDPPNGYVDNKNDDDDNDFCEDKTTYYQDKDGDGLGNPDESIESCEAPSGYVSNADDPIDDTNVNFEFLSSIDIGGEGAAEISAYDPMTQKLFITNGEKDGVAVVDLSDPSAPVEGPFLDVGKVNSVAAHNGLLAIAIENSDAQANGTVAIYNTETMQETQSFEVGPLPDMVTFTPNGVFALVANEGEPNDDYDHDPEGSVSIMNLEDGTVTNAGFQHFNGQESLLSASGFRVFGPNATLAMDVEPEYIATSNDSKTAWVTLQENNGIARIDIERATVTDIYPMGVKNWSDRKNKLDASNKDDVTELKNWPTLGFYMPDAISYFEVDGTGYLITANEGDAREYDGFDEESDVEDLVLDPTVFPNREELQKEENLGKLTATTANGDIDNDGDMDIIYSFGGRSFSIFTENGSMVFESGSEIAEKTLEIAPQYFNLDVEDDATSLTEGDKDDRSDNKGAEPEATAILDMAGERQIAFIGLERTSAVMVYDVSNPANPQFLQWLQRDEDIAPEGLVTIFRNDSPNGKDLMIVSNEVSGTVSIYQNNE